MVEFRPSRHVSDQVVARWEALINYLQRDRPHNWRRLSLIIHHYMSLQSGADPGGGALGRAPTPGTKGPAPKAWVSSFQGQKEGTLVSPEWLFNTIQA